MTTEHKHLDVELKELGDDGTFSMYAAAFGNIDRGSDVIEPGAFANLDEFVKDGWIALNHRQADLAIGYPTAASQDGKGLLVTDKFHSTPEAQACRTIVRERFEAGKGVKASIGYAVNDASYDTRAGQQVRVLKSVNVYECSFVNLPMNPAADVVSAKSLEATAMAMDEHEQGFIAAFKAALGLSTKKGKAISAANHAALSDHASGMADAVKSMQGCVKDFQAKHKAFKEFLDNHAPDSSGDDDGDEKDDGDETMSAPEPATKQLPPPAPIPTREEIAREFAAIRSAS